MYAVALRLKGNLEVERYLRRPNRSPSRKEADYPSFPFIYYTVDFRLFLEDTLPWHWHREIEILEVISGSVTVRSSKSSYIVREGELCYLNPTALHQVLPEPLKENSVFHMHLFTPEFISGGWGNAFDSRYISPILEHRDMDLFYFSSQNSQTEFLRKCLSNARERCDAKSFGYEFDVRNELSEVWKAFFLAASPRLKHVRTLSDRSEERIQKMLGFIQKNYSQNITLKNIAESAMISERECFRCFHNILGISPTLYLRNYRIRMAARKLLETDLPVQVICEACGFRDISYFGRVFHETMHSSPTTFRKSHTQLFRQDDGE